MWNIFLGITHALIKLDIYLKIVLFFNPLIDNLYAFLLYLNSETW